MKRILFVCTGNTCRSPMAEALLRKMAEEEGLEIEVKSAGLSAFDGAEASQYAIEALKEKEIVLNHQAKMVDQSLIEWADLIFTMTRHHKQALIQHYPESADKVFLVKEYGQDHPEIQQLYQQLEQVRMEIEEKRAQAEEAISKQTKDFKNVEAEESWREAILPLLEKEKDLINQLDQFTVNQDVIDPFGGDLEEYRRCLQDLESSIRQIVAKWK